LYIHKARLIHKSNFWHWLNSSTNELHESRIDELNYLVLKCRARRADVFHVIIEIISIHFLLGWTETCFQ